MKTNLVRRDQFNISPQGIVHKPTDAAFTPNPGDPHLGTFRLGSLGSENPNGSDYKREDVQRMMRELWGEYVAAPTPKSYEVKYFLSVSTPRLY